MQYTVPAHDIRIHIAFFGPRPSAMWAYGPLMDELHRPGRATDEGATAVAVSNDGRADVRLRDPEPGAIYGVSWSWEDEA